MILFIQISFVTLWMELFPFLFLNLREIYKGFKWGIIHFRVSMGTCWKHSKCLTENLPVRRYMSGSVGWEQDERNIRIHKNGWESDITKIETLDVFKKNQKNRHKFLKDHFLLITRLFDNWVKAFINNILMANEFVEHYTYRI